MTRVLVVAQTPPPVHGQGIMTQYFLEGEYQTIRLWHVRMAFSSDIRQVGIFRLRKILHLFWLVFRILWMRIKTRSDVLYYPPAGPNLIPVLRDFVLLGLTRWAFKRTVLHFHGNGLSLLYPNLPRFLKRIFRWVYGSPDLSIRLSVSGPDDAAFIKSRKMVCIPNGIPDVTLKRGDRHGGSATRSTGQGAQESHLSESDTKPQAPSSMPPSILFMGTLSEEKGVLVLLEACAILKSKGVTFQCMIAGRAESDQFERLLQDECIRLNLGENVALVGLVSGEKKWDCFRKADIFCFPSFYSSEGFPLVLLEAGQFKLPIVSTSWRGIPDIVQDGETGFLVPVRNPEATADRLERLLKDPELGRRMGQAGRKRYEEEYTVEVFRKKMEEALSELES